ncbi:hypothetical protein KRX52_14770 [Pseudomonas sp. MAP12]|uniref:Uncharacterized protein n=1 Tax=Geopseudomonas aromaticivorans TaxID=2849492 RepID=A0ABS6MZ25_9GAMM|nr:hypothetical protein [Pseudomonas aromaticivorans]MBV2134041.1 hypothetical protein [Pseudomonas aromaticivorans]
MDSPSASPPAARRPNRSARGRSTSTRLLILLGVLAGLALALTLVVQQDLLGRRPPPAPQPVPSVAVPSPAPAEVAPPAPVAAKPKAAAPKPHKPPVERELAQCLPRSGVLDNRVARCRFGTADGAPAEAARSGPAKGMVSAEYLARYRAERENPPPAAADGRLERTSQPIQHSDGKNYLAEWSVRDNQIDHASVCGNYLQNSIEHRECRKAAKAWYRQECRRWEQRQDPERAERAQRMRERYCSAAASFRPAG